MMYTPIFTLADSEFVIPIPGLMFGDGQDATEAVGVAEDLLGITWTGQWKQMVPGEDFKHVNIRIAGSTNVAVISGDLFEGLKREFDRKPTNYQRLVALAETNVVIDNAMVGGGNGEDMLYRVIFALANVYDRQHEQLIKFVSALRPVMEAKHVQAD